MSHEEWNLPADKQEEYAAKIGARRAAIISAKESFPFEPSNASEFEESSSEALDGYSVAIQTYATAWAALMEREMDGGVDLRDCVEAMSQEADLEMISGPMRMRAVQMLVRFWKYGDDLKAWHDEGLLDRISRVLLTHFRECIEQEDDAKALQKVRKHVFTGEDDPGQWSPNALAIVHAEAYPIPGLYLPAYIEKWCQASDELGDCFFEHINDAVVAVYMV